MVMWPQDIIYLTAILIIAALTLFLFTAIGGRLWCGYACPQTVYTELFMWIERHIEGDRAKRMRLDKEPMSARKFALKAAKHGAWIAVALWTGFTFVGYFTPIRELGVEMTTFAAGGWSLFWILFYGFATYGNAGWMREQVCKYMCPYARFQSAMFDPDTLIVTYDRERGEPRGAGSKKSSRTEQGLGDCVACKLCVQVCPTGIDIRNGLQYECIGCAECIDACNYVMDKVGLPSGLIRYSTERALTEHYAAKGIWGHVLRPRVLVYTSILLAVTRCPVCRGRHTRAAQGRRDPRSRRACARGRGRPYRKHLSTAGDEHRGAQPGLCDHGKRPAWPRTGLRADLRPARRNDAFGAGAAAGPSGRHPAGLEQDRHRREIARRPGCGGQ